MNRFPYSVQITASVQSQALEELVRGWGPEEIFLVFKNINSIEREIKEQLEALVKQHGPLHDIKLVADTDVDDRITYEIRARRKMTDKEIAAAKKKARQAAEARKKIAEDSKENDLELMTALAAKHGLSVAFAALEKPKAAKKRTRK